MERTYATEKNILRLKDFEKPEVAIKKVCVFKLLSFNDTHKISAGYTGLKVSKIHVLSILLSRTKQSIYIFPLTGLNNNRAHQPLVQSTKIPLPTGRP